jgi:G3E family GTPase
MKQQKTPIYILGGYLGSGKTTLLKRLLRHELARGVRPAVLMNEFGDADVDGELVTGADRAHDVELRSLLDGCACCDLQEDLIAGVRDLLGHQPSAMFVETTGLASIGQVVDGVTRALGAENVPPAYIASVTAMVDVPRYRRTLSRWSASREQFVGVDAVILNKTDQSSPEQLDEVSAEVRRLAPSARILQAQFADVPVTRVLTRTARRRPATLDHDPPLDSTQGFRSAAFRLLARIDVDRLAEALSRFDGSLARAKGFVRQPNKSGLWEVQWVPGTFEVRRYDGRALPCLTLIGRRVQWERLLDAIEECAVAPPRRRARA